MIPEILMVTNLGTDSNQRRKQMFSKSLVELKRSDRSLSAIIDGVLIFESQSVTGDSSGAENSSHSDHESLFITGDSDDEEMKDSSPIEAAILKKGPLQHTSKLNSSANPFEPAPSVNGTTATNAAPFANAVSFGKPTSFASSTPPFGNSSTVTKSNTPSSSDPTPLNQQPPKFNFFPPSTTTELTNNMLPASSLTAIKPTVNVLPTSTGNPSPEPKKTLFPSPSTYTLDPTKFSFGSSPLFEAAKAKGNADNHDVTNISDNSMSRSSIPSFQDPKISILPTQPSFSSSATATAPPSASFSSPLSFPKSSETSTTPASTPFSTISPKSFPTTQAIPPLTTSPATLSFASFSKSNSRDEALKPASSPKPMPVTNTGPFSGNFKILPQASSSTATPISSKPTLDPFVPTLSPAKQAKVSPPKPDPRPAVLNLIANSMMLDDAGLLEQFLEYTLGPIIQDSFRQVEDERSWDTARQ